MKWFCRCYRCGASYDLVPGRYLCDVCSQQQQVDRPLEGVLELAWEGAADPQSIPLPVESEWFAPIPVGKTPLWAPQRLREQFGAPNLWLKDDTCNPSGSFKDRASWLVAAFAKKHGVQEIVLASTGNAASSMAAVGAAAGLRIKVFLPASAPPAKRIQVLQYGAELIAVDGSYDQAFDLCLEASRLYGWYNRNTGYNPYTREGKKTCSYEILEQLGWKCPDKVFVSVGDGNIISGLWKGFVDFYSIGLIDRLPQLVGVQAEKSDAIKRAFDAKGLLNPGKAVPTLHRCAEFGRMHVKAGQLPQSGLPRF